MEERGVHAVLCDRFDLVEVGRRCIAEEQANERSDLRHDCGKACRAERLSHAICEAGGDPFEFHIGIGIEEFKGCEASCGRQRITRQGPTLVHASERRNMSHDLSASAVATNGKTAADDLAEGPHVRLHSEPFGRATAGEAETGCLLYTSDAADE